jgi:hypothetical protein
VQLVSSFALGLALALAGCSFQHGAAPGGDGRGADATLGDGRLQDAPRPRDGVVIDSPVLGTCDATACGAAGGTCDAIGECVIDTASSAKVTCPAGMPCVVVCATGNNACSGGVDCGQATRCAVTCRGTNACMGGVTCSAGDCAVQCDGNNACQTETCPVMPASCAFQCCGNNACTGTLCGDCVVTHGGC